MADQSNPYVYEATRGDRRAARQVLAGLRCGEPCPALARITAGPLGRAVRFMAGCLLDFVFIGNDGPRYCSIAGPTVNSASLLIRHLTGDETADLAAGRVPAAVGVQAAYFASASTFRATLIESCMEVVVDGLHERNLAFVLGWQLPGATEARLDLSLGVDQENARRRLSGFLTERLGVSVCNESLHHPSKEVVHG
jgi:hypothetical protein